MKNIKTFLQFVNEKQNYNLTEMLKNTEPRPVTPKDIENIEEEFGEWCVDTADISIAFSDYVEDQKYVNMLENMLKEKYPQIMTYLNSKDYMESIRELKDNKISEQEYYQIMSDIYNLSEGTQVTFWYAYENNGVPYGYSFGIEMMKRK